MRWSIRSQMFVPLLTLLLGVVGISTWAAISAVNRARQQIEKQVRDVARTLDESDFPLTQHVLEQMKGLSGAEFILVGSDGRRTATFQAANVFHPERETQDLDWPTLRLGPPVDIDGRMYRGSRTRLRQTRSGGGATLFILYPEAQWRDALWEAVRPPLVLGLFGGLASVVLMVGVARGLAGRVHHLERHTRQIAGGDFQPMPLPGRNDELRDLGQSINDMAQRLAQFQQTVQTTERLRLLGQVSGGLAHQVRNGVAGARLAVQLHARECTTDAGREALDVALRQLALVELNLKRFLDLGRAEDLRAEPCSLDAVVEETVGLLRPQCRHAHIDLRWHRPEEGYMVRGDATQLSHLLVNVISNAMEAAGPGGWVHIELRRMEGRQPARCCVEVADSGPGPAAAVAPRLFEPFVTSKPEGVGLGLAVARQVVESHGGCISWRREPDRTCFSIELPMQ